jgi:flavodoxin
VDNFLFENLRLVSLGVVIPNIRRFALFAVSTALLGLLSGCSEEEAVPMPSPQITRYVLDLSGSNDYFEQYERLKPVIYDDLNNESLGNPFGKTPAGPKELSITYIIGSASQARVAAITNSEFGFSLYKDMTDVYGRSVLQVKDDWSLVLAAYRDAFKGKFTSVSGCADSIWKVLDTNLGEENAKDISQKVCVFALKATEVIEREIPSTIGKASGSDVFGALREIESWAKKLKENKPTATIKVVIASDMVHNTDGQRDLLGKGGLLKGKVSKNEICQIANDQAVISGLNMSDISFSVIGRGNSSSVSADEAEALAIFWNCFAEKSGFKIDFVTDGNG